MLRQLPQLLMGLGAVVFAAGLTPLVGEPILSWSKAAALATGFVLFAFGAITNTPRARSRIPPLPTLPMRLGPLYDEGARFDNELGAVPREQLDEPDLWMRLQDWDRRLSEVMESEDPEAWAVYRRSVGSLSPPGESGWAEANRSNLAVRLAEIAPDSTVGSRRYPDHRSSLLAQEAGNRLCRTAR
jgi:hypothetical protein